MMNYGEMSKVIEVNGLSRSFDDTTVVDQVTFDVPGSSVTGLIGKNGAGKTTVIKLLLGLLRPDEGSSTIFGEDSLTMSRETRRRIGYLSEESLPYDDMTLPQILRWVSSFFEDWDWKWSQDLVDRLDIPLGQTLEDMSAGERRRSELVVVLAQKPDLLILDDPAVGLDATVRRDFLWAALETTRQEGKSVLMTSHILHDVERAVDRMGFLANGALKEWGELDEIKTRTKRIVIEMNGTPLPDSIPGELTRNEKDGFFIAVTRDFSESWFAPLATRYTATVEDLNLEDIFLSHDRGGVS